MVVAHTISLKTLNLIKFLHRNLRSNYNVHIMLRLTMHYILSFAHCEVLGSTLAHVRTGHAPF